MAKSKLPVILINMFVDNHKGKECEILISNYASRVSDAGGVPMLIPSIEKSDNIQALLDLADGVLFIGGIDYDPKYYGCTPHPKTNMKRLRPHFDLAFGQMVMARQLPVLGICGGCQLISILAGGKLIQHLPNAEKHTKGVFHTATICSDGFFARALGKKTGDEITVNSFHHQAVDPNHLGTGLKITATAFDGSIEVIEGTGPRMILGTQFHPERIDDFAQRVFSMFIEEAKRGKEAYS